MSDTIRLDGKSLTAKDVAAVAYEEIPVELSSTAHEAVTLSRERIQTVLDSDEAIYGVSTGFGRLVDERIGDDDRHELQRNLLRSHAAGTGDPLPVPIVRAMLVTRANALAKGFSGVRPLIIERLIELLNAGVHPVVPRRGSLGASGDLAPLAHLGLVLIGEGQATVSGETVDGDTALSDAGIDPIELEAKEGLALINGTQLSLAIAALAVVHTRRVVDAADTAGALTTEVTLSTTANCDPGIAAVRPHQGHTATAENIRRLTEDSEVIQTHGECERVQDVYSIRCMPQIHGAVRTALEHLTQVVEVELNAATDNPLVFSSDTVDDRAPGAGDAAVLSGGNFHGEPLSLPLEYLQQALATLATVSERRVDRLVNPAFQEDHLPPFLAREPGLESGYMIAQYTSASLGNHARTRGNPSADNVSVSGNQEDHVSMSGEVALAVWETLGSVRTAIGIELLCAVEASRYLEDKLTHGVGTAAAIDEVRDHVSPLSKDREIAPDIEAIDDLIASGELSTTLESVLGSPLRNQATVPDAAGYR